MSPGVSVLACISSPPQPSPNPASWDPTEKRRPPAPHNSWSSQHNSPLFLTTLRGVLLSTRGHTQVALGLPRAGPTLRGGLSPSQRPTLAVLAARAAEGPMRSRSCLPAEQGWRTATGLRTADASVWCIIDGTSNCAFPKVYRPLMKNSWHARGWEQTQSIGSAAGAGGPGPSP